jgi:hypothetical protein
MNELTSLNNQLAELKSKHREEMDDWERMHRNEMLEKDFQIAQLTEDLRHAQGRYEATKAKAIPKILAKITAT